MTWTTSFQQRAGSLIVLVAGLPTTDQLLRVIEEVATWSNANSIDHALIDLQELELFVGRTQFARISMRLQAAVAHMRVAVVMPDYVSTRDDKRDAVVTRRRHQAFSSRTKAENWLSGQTGSSTASP